MLAWSARAAAGLSSTAAIRPPFGQWHPDDLPSYLRLTDRELEVWIRREQDLMSIPEIARVLDVNEGCVWTNIQHLRRKGLKIRADVP